MNIDTRTVNALIEDNCIARGPHLRRDVEALFHYALVGDHMDETLTEIVLVTDLDNVHWFQLIETENA